jgi:hypothetical protein
MNLFYVLLTASGVEGALLGILKLQWFAITISCPVIAVAVSVVLLQNENFWPVASIALVGACLICNQMSYLLGLVLRYQMELCHSADDASPTTRPTDS